MVKENIEDYKDSLDTRVKTFKELSKGGRRVVNLGLILMLMHACILGLSVCNHR